MLSPALDFKKVGLIVVFTLVSLGMLYAVVRIFFVSEAPAPGASQVDLTVPGSTLPESSGRETDAVGQSSPQAVAENENALVADVTAAGGITSVTRLNLHLTLDPVPALDGGVVYYNQADSRFYAAYFDGRASRQLSDEVFVSVAAVSWSPDRNWAVIEFPDGANILYNFTSRKKTTLPRELVDPIFSPNGRQLAYKLKSDNPELNWLVVSDSDGSNAQLVQALGDKTDQVQVIFSPDSQVVAMHFKASSATLAEVLPLGQKGENFRSMNVAGLNFRGLYSPDGRWLLYSTIVAQTNYLPELWLTDSRAQTFGFQQFNLALSSWSDKCTFAPDARSVYCAVPQGLPEGAGLVRDLSYSVGDAIYQIDVATGLKQLLAVPVDDNGANRFSAAKIWLSPSQSSLYFWDFNTGHVYEVKLK